MKNILLSTICILSIANEAHAYLDPATGSALLQGLLGFLAAGFVVIKIYWFRIVKLFTEAKIALKAGHKKKSNK